MKERVPDQPDFIEIDLRKLWSVCLRRWWVIVLCGLLLGGGALFYTMEWITPVYRASVLVYVNNNRVDQEIDYMTDSNLNASQKLVATYTTIARSSRVLDEVAKSLGNRYTADELREMILAEQKDNTGIFEMSVLHTDPKEAKRVANVLADAVPREIAEIVEGSSATVIDYAKLPEERYSPSYVKNTAIGVAAGCLIAAAALILRSFLDVRIKEEEDLFEIAPYPILGMIPNFTHGYDRKNYGGYYGYQQDVAALNQSKEDV